MEDARLKALFLLDGDAASFLTPKDPPKDMRIAAMRQKTAFTLFAIANLFDHAHAIVALALMHTLGFGVKQDLSRALNFWDRLWPEIAEQGLEIGRRFLEDGRIGSPEANAALDQTMDEALDLLDPFEPDPESGRRVPMKDLPGLLIAAREKGERDFVRLVARETKTLLPDLPSACAFLKAQVNGQEHEGFCTEEWLTHLNWKDIETKHARVSAQKGRLRHGPASERREPHGACCLAGKRRRLQDIAVRCLADCP